MFYGYGIIKVLINLEKKIIFFLSGNNINIGTMVVNFETFFGLTKIFKRLFGSTILVF